MASERRETDQVIASSKGELESASKWQVVREAIQSWPATLRLCLIIFVLALPEIAWFLFS